MQMGQLTEHQIEHWRQLYQEELANAKWVADYKELDEQRVVDQQEMLELLNSYLTGRITTERLRAIFDQKTRKDWNTFGFKGMSGAMFLNVLVKHIVDEQALTNQLHAILPVPLNPQDGRKRMRDFIQFLERLISSQQISKRLVQPARVPFFVSAWWHLQATEQWPIFYPRTRQLLELEGLYTASQNPIEDYFTFRDCFLSLAQALGLKAWQLEHLCVWNAWKRKNEGKIDSSELTSHTIKMNVAPIASENVAEVYEEEHQPEAISLLPKAAQEENEEEQVASEHTHIQWLLAKIGQKLGCAVWIAANDQNKMWNGERLGDFSLKKLPNLIDSEFQQIVNFIDVLWLRSTKAVAAAFEVEHTTSIYSGLLRMSDLVALYPNINFPLYIVTPDVRLDKVRRELSRPTFQTLELHKRCGFFSEEKLLQEAEHIMRWANHPSAIERLADKVDDIEG